MFHQHPPPASRGTQWAVAGLALLSLTALLVTLGILSDVGREQEIVKELASHLPADDLPEAAELAGDLRLQWRLSALLILNIVASAVALALLVRAYLSSERSLRNVRVLAADILASIDQGIITTDRDGVILSINPHGRELLDLREIGPGDALDELPPQHAPLRELCREAIAEPGPLHDRDYAVERDGHLRHLRADGSPLRDHEGRRLGSVVHLRDVTENHLMGQRLRRMERYMGLGSLAAGLQHEIKNPLSALSLHVQLLDEALREDGSTPEVREMLDVLNAETRRITGVLEGFRDFASVATLELTEVDGAELVDKLVRLIEPQATRDGVRIEREYARDGSARLVADPGRIEQVLLNLILNAFAAMPGGGRLTLRLEPTADSVDFEVADTGGGIPEKFRDQIFDPYFTTRSAGTGMGLALSEKIVRQHHGSLDFRTGPGGTTFTVSLPRSGPS
ncbi:two-component system sensor histidine kinase NtrB [Alienimonas californiensis]|uniref:histidine kinase n=1 Tax=Alienimonas californiensis TaxID=2527989 RepID=A0A517PAJ4_9PLAN|nr:ATP-binding protein [Alienimonas californiensis]QDT16393.1 Sensor protein ZraS [Alienimonas californiensis]